MRTVSFEPSDILFRGGPRLRDRILSRCQSEAVLTVDGLWHARQTLGVIISLTTIGR